MGVGDQRHAPAALPPGTKLGTHCTGGWVGPRAGRNGGRKISPPPRFDPRTVQPVASGYTDYATPVHEGESVAFHFLATYGLQQLRNLRWHT